MREKDFEVKWHVSKTAAGRIEETVIIVHNEQTLLVQGGVISLFTQQSSCIAFT